MKIPEQPVARGGEFGRRLLSFALICVLLYLGQPVLMPLALAILLTFLLSPLTRRLEKFGVPTVGAVVAAVTLAVVLVVTVGGLMGKQVLQLAEELPEYEKNIVEKIADIRRAAQGGAMERIQKTIDSVSEKVSEEVKVEKKISEAEEAKAAEKGGEEVEDVEEVPASLGGEVAVPVRIEQEVVGGSYDILGLSFPEDFAPVGETLATGGLVLVLVIFMLLKRRDLRNRLIGLAGRANLAVTTTALNEAGRRIARYLLMQFLLNVSYGICVAVGLYFLDVPHASLWGVSAAVLRYLPYIGPWLAALLPISVSLVMQTGWTQVFSVVGLFLALELITNNIAEPRLYGKTVGISEVAIIVAAMFWVFLWGPVGLVLATPMTVCIVVLSNHVKALDFLVQLMGEHHGLSAHVEVYQRLLSRDGDDAVELVLAKVKEVGAVDACDEVVVSALMLAERDRRSGRLDDEEAEFVAEAIEGLAVDLREMASVDERKVPTGVRLRPVLCFPVGGTLDHAALEIFSALCAADGYEVRVLPETMLTGELAAQVAESGAVAVLIGGLATGSPTRRRQLLKRLVAECPGVLVLAGRWSGERVSEKVRLALRGAGAREVFGSFANARVYLRNLMMTDGARFGAT